MANAKGSPSGGRQPPEIGETRGADAPRSDVTPTARRRWPILRFLRRRLQGWRLRHQLPFNFAIHLIGIPLAVSGVVLLFFLPWYWGVGAIVLGYVLQWIGHLAEGNDVGEWAAIKRLLGLPYVGISPRWNPEDPNRL
jgi:hypothetical protein